MTLTVFIGHDSRAPRAFEVASSSLARTSGLQCRPLIDSQLRGSGLLTRPVQWDNGRLIDLISCVPQSTEFAVSRFLVPFLAAPGGWALFTDSDVVFLRDVHELFRAADPTKAVMVVKHEHVPSADGKMDGQAQRTYWRKNWSSVMLWNMAHPANLRLRIKDVNELHRDWLHGFSWLHDSEIGALPPEWNWLVGCTPKPEAPAIAHFTLGGPFTPGWQGAEHDEIWLRAADRL